MIKFITDSTACLKKADAADLGVKIVPVCYTVGKQSFFETFSDKNGNFEDLIKAESKFTTAHPNPASFLSAFEEELLLGNDVLCITISSRLSGTYNSAYSAAKQTERENIYVFDSQLTAGGLQLLLGEAKKLADSGHSLNEIVMKLSEIRDKITVAFSVHDMTPLRNSGRIGFVRIGIGTILNIRPILLCDEGAVVFDSVARGSNEIIEKLVAKVPPEASEVVINYISNERTAIHLHDVLKERHPHLKMKLSKIGPVLAIHLGLQTVGVSFIVS